MIRSPLFTLPLWVGWLGDPFRSSGFEWVTVDGTGVRGWEHPKWSDRPTGRGSLGHIPVGLSKPVVTSTVSPDIGESRWNDPTHWVTPTDTVVTKG